MAPICFHLIPTLHKFYGYVISKIISSTITKTDTENLVLLILLYTHNFICINDILFWLTHWDNWWELGYIDNAMIYVNIRYDKYQYSNMQICKYTYGYKKICQHRKTMRCISINKYYKYFVHWHCSKSNTSLGGQIYNHRK